MKNKSIVNDLKKYSNIFEDLKNGKEVKLTKYITCKIFSGKYHVYECGKLRKSIYSIVDFIQYLDLTQV